MKNMYQAFHNNSYRIVDQSLFFIQINPAIRGHFVYDITIYIIFYLNILGIKASSFKTHDQRDILELKKYDFLKNELWIFPVCYRITKLSFEGL